MFIKTSKTQRGWSEKSKAFHEKQRSTYHARNSNQKGGAFSLAGTDGRGSQEIVVNKMTQKDLSNPIKINEIRLEHFQNFKKLRRRMDHAYLKVRKLQGKQGGVSADTGRSGGGESSRVILG